MAQLTITLKTGNDACLTREDMVSVIKNSFRFIEQEDRDAGYLFDANGQRVGKWEVTE